MTQAKPATAPGRVSIVVPVYNGEAYLPHCLSSLTGQSHPHIEILLIDDGSTDDSARLCREFTRHEPRARLIQTANRGPAAARNTGIEAATGDWLLFVDADDTLPGGAVAALLAAGQATAADLVAGDFEKRVDGRVVESGHDRYFAGSRTLGRAEIRDYVTAYLGKPNRFPLLVYSWGRLFSLPLVRAHGVRFDEGLRTFEDVDFNFRCLRHANALHFCDEIVYSHLVHDNYASASMSIGTRPINLFGYRQALAAARDYLEDTLPGDAAARLVGHAYVCYTIIQCVRLCGQMNATNRALIAATLREIVGDARLATSLPCYVPTPGDSRILPWLMKYRMTGPLAWVSRYKARRRYRKKS